MKIFKKLFGRNKISPEERRDGAKMDGMQRVSCMDVVNIIKDNVSNFQKSEGMVVVLLEGFRIKIFMFDGIAHASWGYNNHIFSTDSTVFLIEPRIELLLSSNAQTLLSGILQREFSEFDMSIGNLWKLNPEGWDYDRMKALHGNDIGIRISFDKILKNQNIIKINNYENEQTRLNNSFCVTLINFSSIEEIDFKERLRITNKTFRLTVRSEKKVSDATYPDSVVHAIVFNYEGLKMITNNDENIIRSASKLGTCRIYLVTQSGSKITNVNSRLDDFIQRTSQNSFEAIVQEIISFFSEADQLNRRSTLLAFRDRLCLRAYEILKILWPVSYISVTVLFLNALTTFIEFRIDKNILLFEYLLPPLTFFGIFFLIHSIITIFRNWLFGLNISKKFNFKFAIGVLGYLFAIAATTYSILIIKYNLMLLCLFSALNIGLYLFYMYARRIRSELNSISGLQTKMTDKLQQVNTLIYIGKEPFSPSSFPLFPFNKKTLFISYMHGSTWSSETAELTHKWANDSGYKVFLDRSTIPSGTLWRRYLLQSISECVFFVAIIDGDADATEWVLAESAYVALLRKNIGKPRILLLVKNLQKITQNKQNPFYLNYLDLFNMPKEYCYGTGILSTENYALSAESFLQALKDIRPMSLLHNKRKPSDILYQIPTPTKVSHTASSTKVSHTVSSTKDLHSIDKAWKTSVLLVVLLTSDKLNNNNQRFLLEKCYQWIKSDSTEKQIVCLYTLNFLYKSNLLPNDKDLSDKVIKLLLTNESIAVKLAALDFLSATGNTQNLESVLSKTITNQIAEFRELIKQKKASQNEYAAKGVYADLQRASAGKNWETALKNVIAKVDEIQINE